MPKTVYLLIDTNCWKRLVDKTKYGNHLKDLEYWVTQRNVTLLVPDVLTSEWERHREIEKTAIDTALKNHKEQARLRKIFNDFSAEFLEQQIDEVRQTLNTQLDTIDELIEQKGLKIETPAIVHGLISAQRKAGKMPFHDRRKDHTNDAELIFTALHFLHEQADFEFFFLSGNINEFAKLPENYLHPDIAEHYPQVATNYLTEFSELYEPFDKLEIPRRVTDSDRRTGKVQNVIFVDRGKPILEQIHQYLNKRFEKLNSIPKELFAIHYPFAIGNAFPYRGNPYTLVTDNPEVFDLLTKVKIKNGEIQEGAEYIGSKEDEEKLKAIFRCLIRNSIEFIAFKDKSEVPLVYSEYSVSCLCSICTFKRLQFQDLLTRPAEKEQNEAGNFHSQIRYAYGQYKIGRFYEAAIIYQHLFDNYGDKKDIWYYILAFNMRSLANTIKSEYWENESIRKFADKLIAIDLDEIFSACSHIDTREEHHLLEFIHNIEFISRPFKKMQEKIDAIVDHFHGQNTGWNTNVRRLREQYAVVLSFLDSNGIIYDIFGDYDKLVAQFTQGLLASYGNNALLGGKLIHFNDYLLSKLLLAGNAEDIQKFLTRYKLKEIEYHQTADDGDTMMDRFEYLLDNHERLEKIYEQGDASNQRYFWDTYGNIIYNGLTLVAMLKLDVLLLNRLAEKSLLLLKQEGHLFYFKLLKHFRFFLNRKHSVLSSELLEKFYKAALQGNISQTDNLFETIADILKNRKIQVVLTDTEFSQVRTLFLEKDELTTNRCFSIGNIFLTVADLGQRMEIRTFVEHSLNKKFDAGQYYLATMFEIIQPTEQWQQQYFKEVEDLITQGQRKRPYVSKEYYTDNRIDNFINYCLHFNLSVPDNIAERFPDMGAYYKWLSDPDSFDYNLFNRDWLYNHFTISFKRRFRKSDILKQHLLHLIRTDPDTDIERIFIMIYCFDD